MKPSTTVESRYRIWDNQTGCRIEVGDDPDGLDMVEIVAVNDDGKRSSQCVYLRLEDVPAVVESLTRVVDYIKARNK